MFKFSLEPVLRYRSSIVEKSQRDLAVVNNLLQQNIADLGKLMDTRKDNSIEYGTNLPELSLEEMIIFDNYFNGNFVDTVKQKQVAANAQKKVDEKRAILVEAIKQKKIIEAARKKALVEYKKIEKKKEEAFLDEVAMTRYGR